MVRVAVWSALTAALISGLTVGRAQSAPRVLTLTDKDFSQQFAVNRGDAIEVRLLFQLSLDWARVDESAFLRESPGYPKSEERPGANLDALGGAMVRVHRYDVIDAPSGPSSLKLMYCRKGSPDLTRQRLESDAIPAPGPFSPDQPEKNLKEGLVFQATLKPGRP